MPKMMALWTCASTVSGLTTVGNRADDAPDADGAVLGHLDIGGLRHVGPEDGLQGDAATGPSRQGLVPVRLLGRKRQDGLGTRRLVEEREAIGDRVLSGSRR